MNMKPARMLRASAISRCTQHNKLQIDAKQRKILIAEVNRQILAFAQQTDSKIESIQCCNA